MAFDWSQYQKVNSDQNLDSNNSDNTKFDWSQYQKAPVNISQQAIPQISPLEAAIRGAASGIATPLVNVPLSALKTGQEAISGNLPSNKLEDLMNEYKSVLAEQNKREDMAKAQQKLAYYGGLGAGALVNPIGGIADTAGLIPEVGVGANAADKIIHSALTGADIGGTYGAGEALAKSSPIENPGESAMDVAKLTGQGIIGGGIFGGTLGALGQAASGAIGKVADSDLPFVSDLAKKFTKGTEGINLLNTKQLTDQVADSATKLGDEGIGGQADDLYKNIQHLVDDATDKGQQVDLRGVMDKVNNLKQQMQGITNPELKSQLGSLLSHVEDHIMGPTENATSMEIKPGEPAVPAPFDELQTKVDKLNQTARLEAVADNTPPARYEVVKVPDANDGKEYLNIRKISPATATNPSPEASWVNKEWIEHTAGTEAGPSTMEPGQPILQRTNPQSMLSPSNALTLEQSLGNQIYGQNAYTSNIAKQAAMELDNLISKQVDKQIVANKVAAGGEGAEFEPQTDPTSYGDLRAEVASFKGAMKDMGLPFDSPQDFVSKDAQGNSVPNPQVGAQLEKLFRKAADDKHTMDSVQLGLSKLDQAGFTGIRDSAEQLFKAIENERLSGGGPTANTLTSPMYSMGRLAVRSSGQIANMAGMAASPAQNAAMQLGLRGGVAQPIAQGLLGNQDIGAANMPGPAMNSNQSPVPMKREDFLGNSIDVSRASSPENFSRRLYSSSNQDLQGVANKLATSPFNQIGQVLSKALTDNNEKSKNAMLYMIASNPKIREYLEGPLEKAVKKVGDVGPDHRMSGW